jgi:hypothetical protein
VVEEAVEIAPEAGGDETVEAVADDVVEVADDAAPAEDDKA